MIHQERLEEIASGLEAALAAEFGGKVVTKEDSALHKGIALAFDGATLGVAKAQELASFISLNLPKLGFPSGAAYLADFGTTIGSEIALPRSWRAPAGSRTRILTLPHEWAHITQHTRGVDAGWWPKVTSHSVLYLASIATNDAAEYLGHVEGDAYGVSEAISRWCGFPSRPTDDVVESLRRHYAIRSAGATVAEATLRSHYRTLDAGGVPNVSAGRVALEWLNMNAADAKGNLG